jgi:hypothetical protein
LNALRAAAALAARYYSAIAGSISPASVEWRARISALSAALQTGEMVPMVFDGKT